MPKWIHADQTGFIPGRECKDNCIKTLLLLQKGKGGQSPGILLCIDAEKAFDRVDWVFMMDTIENLGIGPKMAKWIKNIYNHPTASVKVNGSMSPSFEMFYGTRQGCPLSPLLYVLLLEPILATIRNNTDMGGVKMGEEEHKVAAYADDILFYVSNPRTTLPNLIIGLKRYGELSNLNINSIKSKMLYINLSKKEKLALQREFPFTWGERN